MNTSPTTIEIYDPPMCCPGGMCGPTIDPALLAVDDAILRIKKTQNGNVTIVRYSLTQQSGKFMQHPGVFELLKTQGVAALPVTTVNGKIVKQQEYPSYEQLSNWSQGV
ncbi:arsenical resistance operon trans-acting repressor ArsD [Candidatus Vecturithrix granuli]|uniref:Arsenical resistance operon trans-acting repressor ArsD n=1 Tax=Vecturithrix granuli TaxID=1499967 RepID=A0A081BWG5_VECG1|nr:arsenical resistance operon trans-acting repressor ArsD [Candidatus Vecturithrix granuli]